jgi:hypothetical protein
MRTRLIAQGGNGDADDPAAAESFAAVEVMTLSC